MANFWRLIVYEDVSSYRYGGTEGSTLPAPVSAACGEDISRVQQPARAKRAASAKQEPAEALHPGSPAGLNAAGIPAL
jgi:hypothetical protein